VSFILRMAGRELARQGWRLALIALCLAVGFAAFFATYGFAGRVLAGVRHESRSLLGADLSVAARGEVPPAAVSAAASLPGLQALNVLCDFPTMASTGAADQTAARLVEVRAVEGPYPLAGRLETNPSRPAETIDGLYVDRGLAELLGLRVAVDPGTAPDDLLRLRQGLRLGSGVVPVRGVVGLDDSRQASAFVLGPRVYLPLAAARDLGLITPRSRLSGRLLVALRPGSDLARGAARLAELLPPGARLRVRTHEEAASALARPIRNLNRFVQQLGLFTLFLAGLGAWAILRAYLEGRTREAAVLRCLGAPPGTPAAIYGLTTALVIAAAGLLGMAAGLGTAQLLPRLLGDLIPPAIREGGAVLPPLLETFAAGAMLALVLLPALVRLKDTSPMALLRDEAPQGPRRRLGALAGLAAAALACILILRNAPTAQAGWATAAGMAALVSLLVGLSRLLLRIYRRSAERLPLPLKLALGQLGAKPGLGALLMAVMGLAVFLVLTTQFVKDDLVAPLAAQRGDGRRPNLFLIDVQPEQIGPLRELLRARSGREPMASPMVRARLVSVAGQPVEDGGGDEPGQGMRTREQNLTWRERLSDSETVVAGRFWTDPGGAGTDISLEEGFARSIGAKLGDELGFDVQGRELRGRVTSLRKVLWQSFQPNFFIVFHPSLLAGAPAVWIAAAELDDPHARTALQSELARRYPNVGVVDVAEVVQRIGRVLDLVALVTRSLAALMLVSALLVLGASLLAGRLGRARDLALLRTLGAGPGTLLASLAWEFLLLGGSAAFGACALAWFLARAYSTRILDLPANPSPVVALALLALSAGLTAVVGLLGSWQALRAKPMDVLRSE
jgi:putative ABC transport system permease protein